MSENIVNSIGDMLRGARESKDVSLQAVHDATKISLGVLSALEQDDFDGFESDIYLKGFLRSYAHYLSLDVEAVLGAVCHRRASRDFAGANG